MEAVLELYKTATSKGIVLALDGPDAIKLTVPPRAMTPELREKLVAAKPDLLKLLTPTDRAVDVQPFAGPALEALLDRYGLEQDDWELLAWLTELIATGAAKQVGEIKDPDGQWWNVAATGRQLLLRLESIGSEDADARSEIFALAKSLKFSWDNCKGERLTLPRWPEKHGQELAFAAFLPPPSTAHDPQTGCPFPRPLVRGPGFVCYVPVHSIPSNATHYQISPGQWVEIPHHWRAPPTEGG